MQWPALVVNLKQHVIGNAVKDYAVKAAEIALKLEKPLIICPAVADIDKAFNAVQEFNAQALDWLKIFSQKVDNIALGDSKTGSVCLDSLANAQGSLLNHKESRLYGQGQGFTEQDFHALIETVEKAGQRKGFGLIICADSALTAEKIARTLKEKNLLGSVALAAEWDEFIGQRVSMVNEKPEEIIKSVKAVRAIDEKLPVYCGAGVETAEEINKARKEFGAQGALAATGFTKAPKFNGNFAQALESVLSAIE